MAVACRRTSTRAFETAKLSSQAVNKGRSLRLSTKATVCRAGQPLQGGGFAGAAAEHFVQPIVGIGIRIRGMADPSDFCSFPCDRQQLLIPVEQSQKDRSCRACYPETLQLDEALVRSVPAVFIVFPVAFQFKLGKTDLKPVFVQPGEKGAFSQRSNTASAAGRCHGEEHSAVYQAVYHLSGIIWHHALRRQQHAVEVVDRKRLQH